MAAAESRTDLSDGHLYPEEQALILRAADQRRREFSTVRSCARAALAKLGLPPTPILRGEDGAPIWPAWVVGSMTHCRAYRAAVVGRATAVCSVGVDAEPNEPLPPDVMDVVAREDERAGIACLQATRPEVNWDRLLFSAKESVFKTWYPMNHGWLDFNQIAITTEPVGGTFSAQLIDSSATPVASALTSYTGRWLARDGLLLTAIAVPRTASPSERCLG
ncbi:MAG TPA: 4'-phosphopantetheinyl transferase superfamily protein [Streptosporangiaceae bacterium]|nr:4'-phosphopantetheinyl transferase superfamily protein [Streptosporangiaceae bacterium]